jgi:hypothetical protein
MGADFIGERLLLWRVMPGRLCGWTLFAITGQPMLFGNVIPGPTMKIV